MSKKIDINKEMGLLKVQIENAVHNFSKEHEWAKNYSLKMPYNSIDKDCISIPIEFKIYI